MLSVSVLIRCLACDPAPDLVARNGLEFQEYTLAVRAVTGLFAQASALVRAIAAGVETVWGTPLPWLVGWLHRFYLGFLATSRKPSLIGVVYVVVLRYHTSPIAASTTPRAADQIGELQQFEKRKLLLVRRQEWERLALQGSWKETPGRVALD